MSGDVRSDYRSEDRSLLLRWLRDPLLMPLVRRMPRRLTPNQVTLAGHACLWSTLGAALPASTHGPGTLLALAAGLTVYNLTDTVDGMYARHCGRTSPLGELLDHGLDPLSFGAAVLTYGIVLELPDWLVIASTATIAGVQFITFLHGYRVGHVVLGEAGIIEALAAMSIVCGAAALGLLPLLTRPRYLGVSAAGAIALTLIAGAVLVLPSMRGVRHHLRDLLPLAVLTAVILSWFVRGEIGVTAAALLIIAAASYESLLVTGARLLRHPLSLWDVPLTLLIAGAAGSSLTAPWSRPVQLGLAGVVLAYVGVKGARLFFRIAAQLRQP